MQRIIDGEVGLGEEGRPPPPCWHRGLYRGTEAKEDRSPAGGRTSAGDLLWDYRARSVSGSVGVQVLRFDRRKEGRHP